MSFLKNQNKYCLKIKEFLNGLITTSQDGIKIYYRYIDQFLLINIAFSFSHL